MKIAFATYFDAHYLPRGLALAESLHRHAPDAVLWVLCLDDLAHATLSRLAPPGVRLMSLGEIHAEEPALAAATRDRSRLETYFTLTPILPLAVMRREPEADVVVYLDADLFFFADPRPTLVETLRERSIVIIEHDRADGSAEDARLGRFNVGLVAFARDDQGRACLDRWRAQCLARCSLSTEDGGYGDQKYLDDWPETFSATAILRHAGAGVAPWNVAHRPIERRGGALLARGEPLLFFHFHGLRALPLGVVDSRLGGGRMTRTVRAFVYRPYVDAVVRMAHRASRAGGRPWPPFATLLSEPWLPGRARSGAGDAAGPGRLAWARQTGRRLARDVVAGRLLWTLGGRVF